MSSTSSESDQESEVGEEFDPAELVKHKEGTFSVPKPIASYLSKHVKRCLSKEEREALFKEQDLEVCLVTKVNKYMSEFLGKNFPKENETESTKIQSAILAILRPLTAAWSDLLEAGVKDDPDIPVPATEVVSLIQRTICLVGNASELTSQLRREKILGAIDQSWSKFGSEEFPASHNTLFGEDFQTKLTGMVEKETALAKAVSLTKRHKKEANQAPTRRSGQRPFCFFSKEPPCQVRRQAGQEFSPVLSPYRSQQRCYETTQSAIQPEPVSPRQSSRSQTHVPRAVSPQPTDEPKSLTEEILEVLRSLPVSILPSIGVDLDLTIAKREAHRPVGARLPCFLPNWQRITNSPWVLQTVRGYKLEMLSHPHHSHSAQFKPVNHERSEALAEEIYKLQQKGVVSVVKGEPGQFFSPIFLVPKSDGSWRPVINLRELNTHLAHHHFKMEGIRTVKDVIQSRDWLVKLDLKDAYLSVRVDPEYRRWLRFQWQNRTYQFDTLPFGLSSAPFVFTKLLKPAVAILRQAGIRLVLYLDDMLIMARSAHDARTHLATAMASQSLEFLGFLLDSRMMTISLPNSKIRTIQ